MKHFENIEQMIRNRFACLTKIVDERLIMINCPLFSWSRYLNKKEENKRAVYDRILN